MVSSLSFRVVLLGEIHNPSLHLVYCRNTRNHSSWNATFECDGPLVDGVGRICWESHPTFNSGDVAWMLCATTFVMLQTPAAGLAQGGLVRRKNAISVIGQSFMGMIIGCLLWYTLGYSLVFGPSHGMYVHSMRWCVMPSRRRDGRRQTALHFVHASNRHPCNPYPADETFDQPTTKAG